MASDGEPARGRPSAGGPLAEGAAAVDRGDWAAARDAFDRALSIEETPEALDGMARVLWWLADVAQAVGYRARAFAAFRSRNEPATAARIAFWLSREFRTVLGNAAAANGWFARGERLVSEAPSGPAHGWLALARAEITTDPAAQVRHADSALSLARRYNDPDLEVYALAARGLAGIRDGYVDAGITDLDAALATATEASSPETVGDTLCTLMLAVEVVGDADRLAQWNQVLEQYVSTHRHLSLTGFCSTCCGEVFVISGRWEDADESFKGAIATLEQTGHRSRCAHPVTRLARLRIRQGRLEDAEAMLAEFRDLPEAIEPLAALYLARGKPSAALPLLQRHLGRVDEATLVKAPTLALLTEAHVALATPSVAEPAAERLAELAERSGLDRIRGLALLTAGRIAHATGRRETARTAFDDARAAFEQAAMPMETAIARLELAGVLAAENEAAATEEARTALHGFERLGATSHADATSALLRRLGVRGQTGSKSFGLLTAREEQVLRLVAEGLTNSEIASRLFISTKTAGNHVSSVLTKLGVRTRTEAAAYALRHLPPVAT